MVTILRRFSCDIDWQAKLLEETDHRFPVSRPVPPPGIGFLSGAVNVGAAAKSTRPRSDIAADWDRVVQLTVISAAISRFFQRTLAVLETRLESARAFTRF